MPKLALKHINSHHYQLASSYTRNSASLQRAPHPVEVCSIVLNTHTHTHTRTYTHTYTLTSCSASNGIYSMMASLTRHLASSANSTIAGSSDWDNWPIPITAIHIHSIDTTKACDTVNHFPRADINLRRYLCVTINAFKKHWKLNLVHWHGIWICLTYVIIQ